MRSVCVGVAETGGMDTYAKRVCWRRRDRGNGHIREACVLASPRQGEWTHTRSVCVGVAETGGNGHICEACVSASPRQGEWTHTRSVCVGVAETGRDADPYKIKLNYNK